MESSKCQFSLPTVYEASRDGNLAHTDGTRFPYRGWFDNNTEPERAPTSTSMCEFPQTFGESMFTWKALCFAERFTLVVHADELPPKAPKAPKAYTVKANGLTMQFKVLRTSPTSIMTS